MKLPTDRVLHSAAREATGALITRDGEKWYVIRHSEALKPFLMSVVSDADHWMFVSSSGGLTAGRRNAEHALFPYQTDDKLHEAHHHTGPLTILRAPELWEPFSDRYEGCYHIERNLYKHVLGHQVCFEEINHDLKLRFSYTWQTCTRYGFVRQVCLSNDGSVARSIRVLDGVRNILPYGSTLALQTARSTLLDAYKQSELVGRIGTYSLGSLVVDRPEPAECLQCTTAWSWGLDEAIILLSERQSSNFRRGGRIQEEHKIRAERGAYLVTGDATLLPGQSHSWTFGLDLHQGYAQVVQRMQELEDAPAALLDNVSEAIRQSQEKLQRIIGLSDGFQCSGKPVVNARHTANTLFNVMRGGTPAAQYHIRRDDVERFVRSRNRQLLSRLSRCGLPAEFTIQALHKATDADLPLHRLCLEYLPLTFSRRHGDPSRPWNTFSINVRNADGSNCLDYEGNWRDIFQNWEALALSYPALVVGMISTFLNASTADGYNPYRITREGIDWETPDPSDPWAHIGYWGDHQTVYLHRLLCIAHAHYAELLPALMNKRVFAYGNVPYRLKPYKDMLGDPHHTIIYDEEAACRIEKRVCDVGGDGKLVWSAGHQVYLVTLAEKLIVSLCARLSSFVPGAGIWMNTQRPEWNDANNALAGWGVSVVTLCYLRPFLSLCMDLFASLNRNTVTISVEVVAWLKQLTSALTSALSGRALMDALGEAGSDFRKVIYQSGFSGSMHEIPVSRLQKFCTHARRHVDAAISLNRRPDGLYHAYGMITQLTDTEVTVAPLTLMLEGQVAALSSGLVGAEDAARMLQALRGSALWREDQQSYLLYPDRTLPGFLEKSVIPSAWAEQVPLLDHLISAGELGIAGRTQSGVYYFNPSFVNRASVELALDRLSSIGFADAVKRDRHAILEIFEAVFRHKTFTGRSGTFFKYEGLGSIYWHMVSKLMLSMQELFYRGVDERTNPEALKMLAARYYELRSGIGDHKSPAEYGAFPADPYSHTPADAGAQQPGMTGQVKEDLIGRWNELGVRVSDGRLSFSGALLRRSEFLTKAALFSYYLPSGEVQTVRLRPDTLAFTYQQVLIVYHPATDARLQIHYLSGVSKVHYSQSLSDTDSRDIFDRTGNISRIDVFLSPEGP